MDMSHISQSIFQQNSVLRAGGPFGQVDQTVRRKSLPGDVLNQISTKILDRQESGSAMEAAAKTREIKMDTYTKTESSKALEETSTGLLEFYLHDLKFAANITSNREQDLQAFKERLQGMDQTIRGYQDVLDGKAALPEGRTIEDMADLLNDAKQSREQFWKDGVGRLNGSSEWMSQGKRDAAAERVLGKDARYANMDASTWELNASASDVYAEIDRALEVTHGVTEELNGGIGKIYQVLKDRGYGDKYKRYLESWNTGRTNAFDQSKAISIRQLMLDNIKDAPLHEVKGSG